MDGGQCASGTASDSGASCGMCGDCGGDPVSSTPFLQILHEDGTVETLNDIMVTSPSSMFANPTDGATALKSGQIGNDLYALKIKDLDSKEGLNFFLKEIEYETATIAEFAFAEASFAEDIEIAVDDSHANIFSTGKKRDIETVLSNFGKMEKVADLFSKNINSDYSKDSQPVNQSLCLNANENINFVISKNTDGATYLATAAFFHQLYTGGADHYLEEEAKSSLFGSKKTFLTKSLPVVGSLSLLMAAFLPGSISVDDQSLLKLSNTIPEVHADTPHKSLYYYYKDSSGSWVQFSTIHPRFKLAHKTIVKVPDAAFIGENGTSEIKIVSNTKHFIHSISVVDQAEQIEASNFSAVEGVVNNSEVFSFSENKSLTTLPGDEFSFSVKNIKPESTHLLFKIRGHYSPLVCPNEEAANNWWNKLAKHERDLVSA